MNMNRMKIVVSSALLCGTTQLQAQEPDLPYVSGSTGVDGDLIVPQSLPHRYDFAFAYDAARNETVLFGGYDRGESGVRPAGYKPETWTFNGTEWSQETPDTFVSARYLSEMVYDPVRQEVIMFGGRRADNADLNDTWIWNGTDWTERTPATVPAVRYNHKLAWDPSNQRVLMFGGQNATGWLEDLWSWDGTNWTEVTTTNTPEADFRQQNHGDMVWEASTGRLIYYNEWHQKTYALTGETWAVIDTGQKPNHGSFHRMVYDPVREEIVSTAANQTWVFKNNEWSQKSPETNMTNRSQHGLVWDSNQQVVLAFGGNRSNQWWFQDTRSWNGETWTPLLGRDYVIDLNEKPNGVYQFGSITVPVSVDVRFIRNTSNTPVTWLATGKVLINGRVFLNGEDGPANDFSGRVARGGPGGFDGGLGGVRFDVSGSYAGTPGQGPGGGPAPTDARQTGGAGQYTGVYGNTLIQPLVGGSGGGGGSSSDNANGGNGGGGGGAILIASSGDIEINGGIYANGGNRAWGGASYGGYGAGGAVRLVADRVIGNGEVEANGPSNGGEGRVRLEGFFRPFAPNTSPVPSATAPVESIDIENQPTLLVTSVAGEVVANPPTGNQSTPDVVFTEAGVVTITVTGTGIPAGTPVTLRITSSEGVINLPADGQPDVLLGAGGTATFSATVPKGTGTIQAFAEFTLNE